MLARWTPADRSMPVRDLVTQLGAIVALFTALSIPIGYGIIGYFKEASALTYKAELSAARAAQYIYAPDAPWKYDTDQLAAMSEIRTTATAAIVQRIVDPRGAVMMQKGDLLAWPTFARRAPIFATGAMVGSAEVSASLRPLLAEVAWVGFGSLALAIAAYFAFTLLPLRALDRTLAALGTTNDKLERQNLLLKQREEELEAQNTRFNAAINNMSQGMCLFNSEQHVMFANRRFAEVYNLDPEQVRPGTTLRHILEARAATGAYSNIDADKFVADGVASFGQEMAQIVHLADGRFISVLRRPMPDGGLVSTHEDITEREKLNARLEQQHLLVKQQEERLRLQNMQLDAALNNMVQGLAMFDADLRVVIANDRYAEIYGLTIAQVVPGTTLQQILEDRIAGGSCCGKTADQMLQAMLARAAGKGDNEYISTLSDGRHIAISLQRMADGGIVTTHQDITDQRRSEAKIVHMALHDALTDLPNRVLLNERLEQALARARRGDLVAVHLLDLDHFKIVNDTLGHPAGDRLLKMVTQRLRSLVRETDTIARMGGDEFAVLQVAISQPADATVLALRIIETVSAPYDLDGTQVVIGTSVGIAIGPVDGHTPDQLIRNSDLALYRAKADGRSTYRFFGPEMDAQMRVRRAMELDLRKALAADEFELHYQPVVNLGNDEISGVEALIRWRHPEKGLVPPNTFIPVAEEIGFIIQLGEWALRQACAAARNWPDHIRIAVNLSPIQFRNPGFVQIVISALAASGLAPERLELEITEGMLLQDNEGTLNTLFQLRALGVRIAMDDFGTGYSSLSYLQSFPFDKIKIDRSFVKDIADGVGSLNIVRAVAAMANGLGMTTTAEGVETKEQLDTVRAEGCTEMQGFLFSRPLPLDELERLLQASCNGVRRADAAAPTDRAA